MPPRVSSFSWSPEKSNNRYFSEVDPRLATRIFTSLQPLAEARKPFVRTGYDLNADDTSDLRGGGGPGVCGRLDSRDIPAEKRGDIAAANFFPADQLHIG